MTKKLFAVLGAVLFALTVTTADVCAVAKLITVTGQSTETTKEAANSDVAKKLALDDAVAQAKAQAATVLGDYARTHDLTLTRDEVDAVVPEMISVARTDYKVKRVAPGSFQTTVRADIYVIDDYIGEKLTEYRRAQIPQDVLEADMQKMREYIERQYQGPERQSLVKNTEGDPVAAALVQFLDEMNQKHYYVALKHIDRAMDIWDAFAMEIKAQHLFNDEFAFMWNHNLALMRLMQGEATYLCKAADAAYGHFRYVKGFTVDTPRTLLSDDMTKDLLYYVGVLERWKAAQPIK